MHGGLLPAAEKQIVDIVDGVIECRALIRVSGRRLVLEILPRELPRNLRQFVLRGSVQELARAAQQNARPPIRYVAQHFDSTQLKWKEIVVDVVDPGFFEVDA